MSYTKEILDNELTVILAPRDNTHIVSIGFFIDSGARNETDKNNGIAHYLEHMMFKGTKNRTAKKLFTELDTLGSYYNAGTSSEFTYYYVSGHSKNVKQLLDIMMDIYVNASFSIKEIEREKKVIIEEMRMHQDSPSFKVQTMMYEKMYGGTSLARNIIGTPDTILGFTKKDLIEFKNETYTPARTVFVMAGNFAVNPIWKLIKPILSSVTSSNKKSVSYSHEKKIIISKMEAQLKPHISIRRSKLHNQIYALIVFPMYDLYKEYEIEITLLTKILSAGFSSRLYYNLREKNGITYVSNAYPLVNKDNGLFVIELILTPTELSKTLNIVMSILKNLKRTPIGSIELEKAINITNTITYNSLIKPLDILTYYGFEFLENRDKDPDPEKIVKRVNKADSKNIKKVANMIFLKDKLNIFLFGSVPTGVTFDEFKL